MKPDFDKLLMQESPDAIVATTPEGEVVYWNKGAEVIFGYSAEEAVGKDLIGLVVPADRVEDARKLQQGVVETGFYTYESLRRRKNGSLVNVDISKKALRDAQGKVEWIISMEKDVTHLQVLRDAKLVEARFRDLLESTPDGIVMVNPTGRIVHTNSQAETLFGYGR